MTRPTDAAGELVVALRRRADDLPDQLMYERALMRMAADRLATLEASQSEKPANEYICKCGVRVVPHRCPTGSDF